MRHVLVAALLFAGLTSPMAGQTEEWKTFKNEGGNFSVLLPTEAKETVAGGGDQGPESHTFMATSNSVSYVLVYVYTKPEQPATEEEFKIYRDSLMQNFAGCQIATEGAAAPPVPNHVGHFYTMNCDFKGVKMTVIGDLYWGKHYSYAVLSMYAAGGASPAGARKFTDSFAVLDASK